MRKLANVATVRSGARRFGAPPALAAFAGLPVCASLALQIAGMVGCQATGAGPATPGRVSPDPAKSPGSPQSGASTGSVRVAVSASGGAGGAVRSFVPDRDVGTSIDALPDGVVDKVYTDRILRESLSAGWGPMSYRQNTELRIAAWHWNAKGKWSDEASKSGYFTGSSELGDPIRHSFGYWLPHRGDTRNPGTDAGFSRLTDGAALSYWKSHPYLTRKFTGEPKDNPQWVVVDLGAPQAVNALRIDWAAPYARAYEVQYWTGENAMDAPTSGGWHTFDHGAVTGGRGGSVTLKLAEAPIQTSYVRIWMTESSDTCDSHGARDPRNCVGFAIRELYAGTLAAGRAGPLVDLVHHSADQRQTATHCSSIDPWHASSDLHAEGDEVDQTGLDLFYTSGITSRLPAIIPVTLLYGTPDDSAAQIAYVKRRGYPISYVEMGEEPDGQYMLPEDYAALYLQWAAAIHRVAPDLKLGGPSFTSQNEDIAAWPDAQGKTSWLGRFLAYLNARGRLSDLAFFSFEHYPYEPCKIAWSDLYREPEIIAHIMQVWRDDGLPPNVPMLITESNVAPDLTRAMVEVFGGLWLADSVGAFFANGGSGYYHSPIQPEPLQPGCDGLTTYGNFVSDEDFRIRAYTAQYFASRLINLEWLEKGGGTHQMFPSVTDVKDAEGHTPVTSYAVRRPDGQWSVLLVNRDASSGYDVRVVFEGAPGGAPATLAPPVRVTTFGSEQYAWQADAAAPGPSPDGPWISRTVQADTISLPKASVTVVRGALAAKSR
jgi:hypothetical protein